MADKKPRKKDVVVNRQYISCHNAEWGAYLRGRGWHRGGSLAGALSQAAKLIDPKVGGVIIVQPDTIGGGS